MGDEESASIVLTNKLGGFAWLAAQPESKYQGVFFRLGNQVFKTIADISVNEKLNDMTNQLWSVQRDYETTKQRILMPHGRNALLVEFSAPTTVDIMLDCGLIDDYREWGRNYTIAPEKSGILITFRKRNDKRDDSVHKEECTLHLALVGEGFDFFPVKEWKEQHYIFDEHRKSPPWKRWVFHAGMVRAQRFVVGAGLTKDQALREAQTVLRSRMMLIHKQMAAVKNVMHHKQLPNKTVDLAYQCARHALDSLVVKDQGLYAGIPWFCQFWLRDEAVSCTALRLLGNHRLVKTILQRHLSSFRPKVLPFAFKGHSLRTVDGPGWVGLRYAQHSDLFTPQEKRAAEKFLHNAFHAFTHRLENGFVMNGPLETWMDTDFNGQDTRAGARIEVQALVLALARVLGETDFEEQLKQRVRDAFWNGSYLADGLGDSTIRPNLFIAAYAYPNLLSREEWERCFDAVLPKLWLPWGGLASIDTTHPLFTDHYTGQDNVSYHRGDSWFWLNNLAAMVLHRTNAEKYQSHINQVLEASSYEILNLGAIGHHAEVSSARALSSHGCVSQAWSAAMFIELCNEVFSAFNKA